MLVFVLVIVVLLSLFPLGDFSKIMFALQRSDLFAGMEMGPSCVISHTLGFEMIACLGSPFFGEIWRQSGALVEA